MITKKLITTINTFVCKFASFQLLPIYYIKHYQSIILTFYLLLMETSQALFNDLLKISPWPDQYQHSRMRVLFQSLEPYTSALAGSQDVSYLQQCHQETLKPGFLCFSVVTSFAPHCSAHPEQGITVFLLISLFTAHDLKNKLKKSHMKIH